MVGVALGVIGGAASAAAIPWPLVVTATLSAFAGAALGKRLLPKMTVDVLQRIVGVLLVGVGLSLALGVT